MHCIKVKKEYSNDMQLSLRVNFISSCLLRLTCWFIYVKNKSPCIMYTEKISLSRDMTESVLFPQYRKYSVAQQGRINPLIHSYLALVFLGDFHKPHGTEHSQSSYSSFSS